MRENLVSIIFWSKKTNHGNFRTFVICKLFKALYNKFRILDNFIQVIMKNC